MLVLSSQAIVPIEEPSPDNLLKFRSRSSASTLRFNRETFRDSPTSTPDLDELGTAFDAVLEQTLQLESALDADSDDSDALPDLSQPVTARPAKELKRKKRTDSSEEEAEVRVDSESEDELLREKDEVSRSEIAIVPDSMRLFPTEILLSTVSLSTASRKKPEDGGQLRASATPMTTNLRKGATRRTAPNADSR